VPANRVTVYHAVTPVYKPHVSVTVLYNGWSQSISILITDITFCSKMMRICQYVYVLLFFPCYSWQSPFTQVFISPNVSLSFLPKSLGIPFRFALTIPYKFMAFVCKSSNKPGEENKICLCSVCVQNSKSLY
jgi:hypothetical protein